MQRRRSETPTMNLVPSGRTSGPSPSSGLTENAETNPAIERSAPEIGATGGTNQAIAKESAESAPGNWA
jgi:hypothetical protein